MTINQTLNYLLAHRADLLLCFSAQMTSGAMYLKCAGGESGDGLPLPRPARVRRIDCLDGTDLVSADGNIQFAQGNRLSVYASPATGGFDVIVRKNGQDTDLKASGAAQSATLMVTVHLTLIDD